MLLETPEGQGLEGRSGEPFLVAQWKSRAAASTGVTHPFSGPLEFKAVPYPLWVGKPIFRSHS